MLLMVQDFTSCRGSAPNDQRCFCVLGSYTGTFWLSLVLEEITLDTCCPLWYQLVSVQVFIPEQVAYSKPELERHMRTGDLTGPMAESGFKGHPQCRSAHQSLTCERASAEGFTTWL